MPKKCVSYVENIVLKKNIKIDFFIFCLKSDFKLIRYVFINLFWRIISLIFNNNQYEINRFRYLKNVANLENKIHFYSKKLKKHNYFDIKADIYICRMPSIIIKKLINENVISYELDKDYKVLIEDFNQKLLDLSDVDILYTNSISHNVIRAYKSYFVRKRVMLNINRNSIIRFLGNFISKAILIVLLSVFITLIGFFYTHEYFEFKYLSLYNDPKLFFMNFIPCLFVIIILILITKRISLSFFITGLVTLTFGIVNQTKLIYRDDVLKLLKEASIMLQRYDIVIKKYTILFLLMILLIFLILRRYVQKINLKFYIRFSF